MSVLQTALVRISSLLRLYCLWFDHSLLQPTLRISALSPSLHRCHRHRHLLEFNIPHPGCFVTSSSLLNSELHHYVQYGTLLLFTFSWHFSCFELLHSKVVTSNYDANLRSWNRAFLGWDGSLMILVALVLCLLVLMSPVQCSVIQPWLPSGDTKSPERSSIQARVMFWVSRLCFFHSTAVEGPCGDSKLPNWARWHRCDPMKHMSLRGNSVFVAKHVRFPLVSVKWCSKDEVFKLRTETGIRCLRLKHV